MGGGQLWRRVLADLHSVITTTGPMSVASYMKHVLTHPLHGYYVRQKPLDNDRGDFVTSPQLSQMFGEMVGAWTVKEWQLSGKPTSVNFVELGPGTGLLMHDIIQSFTSLTKQEANVVTDVHLVEASPVMSQQQYETLGCGQAPDLSNVDLTRNEEYLTGRGHAGINFHWYRHLWALPKLPGFTFLYAHEFFDTMPTHQFQLTEDGWRERMVDVCDEAPHQLRFVLSPKETVQSKLYASLPLVRTARVGDVGEVSFEAMEQAELVAHTLATSTMGGRALIFDYGDTTKFDDTFRAFRDHQQVHVFDQPGSADLTTDVNFDHLLVAAARSHQVVSHGPVTQRQFLLRCGLQQRADALLASTTDAKARASIEKHTRMLTDPDEMGERFKVMAMTDANADHTPVLFD